MTIYQCVACGVELPIEDAVKVQYTQCGRPRSEYYCKGCYSAEASMLEADVDAAIENDGTVD